MKQPWLPYDVARCHGEDNLQCLDCLRRTAPGNPHRQSYRFARKAPYFECGDE